jgi:hypothetical protein
VDSTELTLAKSSVAKRTSASGIFPRFPVCSALLCGSGHWRKDLTDEQVKFFPIYSYLIAYRPNTKPLQVVASLHGRRDVEQLLKDRS